MFYPPVGELLFFRSQGYLGALTALQYHPCPLEIQFILLLKPQHVLAVFAVSVVLDTETKRSLSQGEFLGVFGVKHFVREHFLTKENIKESILLKNTRSVGEEVLSSSILWAGFITERSHFTELVS